jgi:hypothetical protein
VRLLPMVLQVCTTKGCFESTVKKNQDTRNKFKVVSNLKFCAAFFIPKKYTLYLQIIIQDSIMALSLHYFICPSCKIDIDLGGDD